MNTVHTSSAVGYVVYVVYEGARINQKKKNARVINNTILVSIGSKSAFSVYLENYNVTCLG